MRVLVAALCGAFLAPAAVHADRRSDLLLREAARKAFQVRSVELHYTMRLAEKGRTQETRGVVRFRRPDQVSLQVLNGPSPHRVVSDGKQVVSEDRRKQEYTPAAAPSLKGDDFGPFMEAGILLTQFFDPKTPAGQTSYAGTRTIGARRYRTVRIRSRAGGQEGALVYLGPSGLIEGFDAVIAQGGSQTRITQRTTRLRLNLPLSPRRFSYKPPAGFTMASTTDDPEKLLLPIGKQAPEFNLPRPGGGRLSLSAVRKQKKVVLVNFWFANCIPCREEFPHFQKLYDELKDRGFDIVAVNSEDSDDRVQRFLAEEKITFNVVLGGASSEQIIGKQWGVQIFPTSYLVDSAGKILYRTIGYDEAGIRGALKKAGVE
jgi:peroxiredoxin/outer membrane lipoprotein-sorting protein